MGGFALPCWIPPGVVQRMGPTEGAYEGPSQRRSRDTEARSHERGTASWGPLGMAHCVWLLTFERPSD